MMASRTWMYSGFNDAQRETLVKNLCEWAKSAENVTLCDLTIAFWKGLCVQPSQSSQNIRNTGNPSSLDFAPELLGWPPDYSHSLVLEAIIALYNYMYTTCMYMYMYYLFA